MGDRLTSGKCFFDGFRPECAVSVPAYQHGTDTREITEVAAAAMEQIIRVADHGAKIGANMARLSERFKRLVETKVLSPEEAEAYQELYHETLERIELLAEGANMRITDAVKEFPANGRQSSLLDELLDGFFDL